MPTYTFRHKTTQVISDRVMRMSEIDSFKEANPDLEQIIPVSNFVRGINQKPSAGFREVLKNIKRANRRSNINTFD
jgi:hypothetical protein